MSRSIVLVIAVAVAGWAPATAQAWSWPVGGDVVRPFSNVDDPYASGQHRGVDVTATAGEPVRAPAGGVVSFAGPVPTSGRTVSILTADGYSVTLTHLGAVRVSKGIDRRRGRVGRRRRLELVRRRRPAPTSISAFASPPTRTGTSIRSVRRPAERPADSRRSGRRDARARARAPSRSVGADIDAGTELTQPESTNGDAPAAPAARTRVDGPATAPPPASARRRRRTRARAGCRAIVADTVVSSGARGGRPSSCRRRPAASSRQHRATRTAAVGSGDSSDSGRRAWRPERPLGRPSPHRASQSADRRRTGNLERRAPGRSRCRCRG